MQELVECAPDVNVIVKNLRLYEEEPVKPPYIDLTEDSPKKPTTLPMMMTSESTPESSPVRGVNRERSRSPIHHQLPKVV